MWHVHASIDIMSARPTGTEEYGGAVCSLGKASARVIVSVSVLCPRAVLRERRLWYHEQQL